MDWLWHAKHRSRKLRSWKDSGHAPHQRSCVLAKSTQGGSHPGIGSFVDANHIEVLQGTKRRVVDFKHASLPLDPSPHACPGCRTSRHHGFDRKRSRLPEKVKRLLVVGGHHGLEHACVYDALGAKVTVRAHR